MRRNGWPASIGIPGRHESESVAGMNRNRWPAWLGILTYFRAPVVSARCKLNYSIHMNAQDTNTQSPRKPWPLIRAVAVLPLKLMLSAGRDLVLIPLALAAALIDFIQLRSQAPRHFRSVLQIGEHSDRWIDVWYSAHDSQQKPRGNVDALLSRVEEVVRDPKTGARRARVLKRWAERQMAQARQRAAVEVSTRMKAISDRKNESIDRRE